MYVVLVVLKEKQGKRAKNKWQQLSKYVPAAMNTHTTIEELLDAIFFVRSNPSSHTVTLELTHPLTEMITRNFLWGKGWPAYKADNLTAISEPIV
jgi:hypothetical protein